MTRDVLTGHLAMFAFSALVSFSFTFGRAIAGEIDPAVLTAVRFVIAAVAMAILAAGMGLSRRHLFHRFWRWGVIGGCMAVYFITMFEALRLTTALSTSVVFTLTPFLAAIIGRMVLGQRVGVVTVTALALGALGTLWVIFRGDLARALAFDIGPGERIFLIGALTHAAVPALTRRLAPQASPFDAAFGTVFGALLVTGIYAFPAALHTDFSIVPAAVWWVALYLGVVTTAGTFFLLQTAVPRLSPGKVMAYTYLVPSWVVLHGLAQGHVEDPVIYIGVLATLGALLILLFHRGA